MAKIDFGFDHFLKLLVVGGDDSSRVGKSSLVRTFCEGVFPPLLNTTDLDSKCVDWLAGPINSSRDGTGQPV